MLNMGRTYKGELSPCAGVGGEQRAGDVAQLHHRPPSPQVTDNLFRYYKLNLTEAQLLIKSFTLQGRILHCGWGEEAEEQVNPYATTAEECDVSES